jgi:hypothetical protein
MIRGGARRNRENAHSSARIAGAKEMGPASARKKIAFLPAMRKDAQFFRKNAELEREVWLTSVQLIA